MLVEPLRPIVENAKAATNSAIVAAFSRAGVSHDRSRVCNQLRAPLAPAAATIAHAAHMAVIVEVQRSVRAAAREWGIRPSSPREREAMATADA